MDKTNKALQPRKRRGSTIWNRMNRGTARLYAILVNSLSGRILTGYRRTEERLFRRKPDLTGGAGRYRLTPASPRRLRLVEAVESGGIIRGLRAMPEALLDCPAACYGCFCLICGLVSALFCFAIPYMTKSFTVSRGNLLFSALMALISIPLILTRRSMAESMGRSPLLRRILVRFLGIPEDRLTAPFGQHTAGNFAMSYYTACALGLVTATLCLFVAPWVVMLILLLLAVVSMIFAYPETGVVLTTLMLPAIWLDRLFMVPAVGMILLTWCSYGVKILLMHRTFRLGLLDRVVLVFGGMVLLTGFTGYTISGESVWQSICLAICISDYFLIVNLMNTRAYIRRCLVGVGLSVAVVTVLAYIRRIPVENLAWLEGSRAGDAIIHGVENAVEQLSQLWLDHSELYLVLAFTWLYAYLVYAKRFFGKILCGLLILLDLLLIVMTNSVSALFCIAAVTLLFLLMLGHKWFSAGLLSLPLVVCGVGWMSYLYPVSESIQTILSRSRLYKAQLTESLWRMAWDHPAGIGVGEEAFASVYPAYAAPDLGAVSDSGNLFFELLLSYGWPGILLSAAVLFLFLQKSLTSLRHTSVSRDRAMILGGVTSLVGMLIFGSVRSFITSPRVFFTVALVVSLCSAYENIIFEESDMRRAEWAGSPDSDNRFYRSGEFLSASSSRGDSLPRRG